MRIVDLMKKSGIKLGVSVSSKEDAINVMVDLQEKSGNISDKELYKAGILAREEESSTAVGMGIAIPHAKNKAVTKPGLVAITIPQGVDYKSPGGDLSTLLFMIAAPENGSDVHLEVLSRLMTMLMDTNFSDSLRNAKNEDEFLKIIDEKEAEKYPDTAEEKSTITDKKNGFIVAVTACPTGIAHTYMAAESLEKKAEEMGVSLKCETNGSGGAKNVLTDDEIAKADGVIIAADITINLARFDGKKVIQCKVADGIHKAEELINRILKGDVPVYHHKGAKTSDSGKKAGGSVYGHLMNGVSHMLPFVVAGGLFIAVAFLIDTIYGNAGSSDFGSVSPVAAWFKQMGNMAFGLMVPILAGYIAMSIADRPGLLVGLVGGYLATSGATFVAPAGDVPSGFLGGLLAGFAGGYIMLYIEKACEKFPKSLEGIKPVLVYPLLGLGAIALIMCTVNPFMGLINTGMSNALTAMSEIEGLMVPLCALLAGMMAIDMGGPFNKAAYVFATGMLALQTDAAYMIMAAVMIGGMVPPLAIALSSTFFKNRWTEDERQNAPVNYIMGLSFITEGAIPYAASYPLKVIPSCIVGSACAGALSALFGCKLMAPHGGVFVFATMAGTWYFYLLALAVGSVISMFILSLLKKPIDNK